MTCHTSAARPGVDYTHPDLGGCLGTGCRVAYGHNFIENNGDPRDTCIGVQLLPLTFSDATGLIAWYIAAYRLAMWCVLCCQRRASFLAPLPVPSLVFAAVSAVPMPMPHRVAAHHRQVSP